MTTDTLEHLRAKHADGCVNAIFTGLNCQEDGSPAHRYCSVAQSAPFYVRHCGLLQWAAFCRSKDQGEEWTLLNDVMCWLSENPVTSTIGDAANGRPGIPHREANVNPVPALLERTSVEIAVLEREVLAYLGWLKRLADGRWNMLPVNRSKGKKTERQAGGARDERGGQEDGNH